MGRFCLEEDFSSNGASLKQFLKLSTEKILKVGEKSTELFRSQNFSALIGIIVEKLLDDYFNVSSETVYVWRNFD